MNSNPDKSNLNNGALFAHLGLDLPTLNEQLSQQSAEERIKWALNIFQGHILLTSSFGAQAAVMLHMVTEQQADIPIVVLDTGYLFPETYRFIDSLTERLHLNLKVYRAGQGAAWQEACYGKLWEQGLDGLEKYNRLNKVEPMQRALQELDAWAWLAGLRRQQSSTRGNLDVLAVQGPRLKIHPIVEWTDRDVYQYLKKHDLPYHPLWDQGYVSIGDWHSTTALQPGMKEEETRFGGIKRECGLHEGTSRVS